MKQVREVQTSRQVRGLAGAVMCETSHLGIKWPFWHTLTLEGDRSIVQQARNVCWKKWAAKHEYEELKEGIWLEPALALVRKKTKEKRRNVARESFLEGGWVQKRLFDISWSDGSKRQACHVELPRKVRDQTGDSRRRGVPEAVMSGFRRWEQTKLQRRSGSGTEVSSSTL